MQLALNELRSKLNISQGELAKAMGVSRQQVGNIENGRSEMSMESLYRICETFNVTPNELFKFSKKPFEAVIIGPGPETREKTHEVPDARYMIGEIERLWEKINNLEEKVLK